MADNKLIVGRVGRPHGLQGWVKIHSFTDPITNILEYTPWQLCHRDHRQTFESIETQVIDQQIIARFPGCRDRDAASQYCHHDIAITRDQLPILPPETSYYWTDLEGLTVHDQHDRVLGEVIYLLETPNHDVLVVKNSHGHESLIPFMMGETIQSVDLAAGIIHVDWEP